MYVYVAKTGVIKLISEQRLHGSWVNECSVHVVECKKTDRLIYEDNQIKLYEESKQYIEDTNRYKKEKEIEQLKKSNEQLNIIANNKIQKEMKLDEKWKKADSFYQQLYIIQQKRHEAKKSATQQTDCVV